MRPIASVAEMQAADARAAARDPAAAANLIGRAGSAVSHRALDLLGGGYGKRVIIVAGKGNNGADGRVAARRLRRRGARVQIIDAASAPASLPDCDLVIDAAYGTGFRGVYQAPDPLGAPVLSVDIPSGVDGDTGAACDGAVRAAATVTFAALKPGLLLGDGPACAGEITVADIGLDLGEVGAHLVDDDDIDAWLPARHRAAHKWDRAVWIIAGSGGMRGSAVMCARSALRAGAGMVYLGSPGLRSSEHPATEAVAQTLPAEGWDADVLATIGRFGSVVVGPGLGRAPAVSAALANLVVASPVPLVVDADGLNAFASASALRGAVEGAKAGAVLTPHDGEFARLAGAPPGADRLAAARALSGRTGAVVLLKGPTTVVADPDGSVLIAAAGDARLATAGTGDVLAGVIGAFLAAGMSVHQAAALAAHVHGRAAALGPPVGLVAGDLPDLLPRVLSLRH